MNVGEILGLDGDSQLIDDARRRWPQWRSADRRLGAISTFDDLRPSLRQVSKGRAEEVLHALATLAAADGGDDKAAAGALAKALLPGASLLAGRLTRQLRTTHPHLVASGRVNELVASQLWIEARTFAWRRLTTVGGNVLMNTKNAVLLEFGDRRQLARHDPAWGRTVHVQDDLLDLVAGGLPGRLDDGPVGQTDALCPAEEVATILDWALEAKVISAEDRSLLLCLLREARHVEIRSTSRGRANLCGNQLTARVAPMLGTSPATVRRRTAHSVQALAAAVPSGLCA